MSGLLTNNASRLQHLKGSIKLNSGPSDDDLYVNLKWQELTNPTTVKTDSVVNKMSKSTLVSDLTMESKETRTWYIAVWLSETDYDQKYVDIGVFDGLVMFEVVESIEIDGELNEYGFYYDKLYETEMNGTLVGNAFHEDGSVSYYFDGVLDETEPAGTAVYEVGKITVSDDIAIISNDGTELIVAGIYVFTLKGVTKEYDNNLQFGKMYGNYGVDVASTRTLAGRGLKFYEDGTAEFYIFDKLTLTFSWSYTNNLITLLHEEVQIYASLSNDGMIITDDGSLLGSLSLLSMVETNDYKYYWTYVGEWGAITKDKYKSSYDIIETTINSIPVININGVYSSCVNLTGEVQINFDPSYYTDAFTGTVKPITITGTSSTATKAALAATANNGNVSY